MTLTNFPNGISSFGIPVLGGAQIPFTGKYFFVDPVNGSDGNRGLSPAKAFSTLYKAHASMTDGDNDVCFLIGNGAASGTARLSTANAASVDSSATTGVLTWSKSACHLIGITAPARVASRARIAPPSGTYTVTTFGSANFIVVSGSGCYFANFSIFHGFSTGGTAQITLTVTGSRNCFDNVHIGGMGDTASAQSAASRDVKIGSGGSGENTFVNCVIGLDTVARTVANAHVELAGATPRNQFIDCIFPVSAAAGTLGILGTGNGCADRWNLFQRCKFLNAMSSGATARTVIGSFTTASPGGYVMLDRCSFVDDGSTNWGDTNFLANCYLDGGPPTAATSGISVKPT